MAVLIPHGPTPDADPDLGLIVAALEKYLTDHPGATAEVYRRGRYLVRARVTDAGFAGLTQGQRRRRVWGYFHGLPDEVVGDVTFLVTVTPDERHSGASQEFDEPTPLTGGIGLFITGRAAGPGGVGLSITGAPPAPSS